MTALSLDKYGNEIRANLRILGVDDAPVLEPPKTLNSLLSATLAIQTDPSNNAALLVNLKAFTGYPEITFWLEETVGSVSLGPGNFGLRSNLPLSIGLLGGRGTRSCSI